MQNPHTEHSSSYDDPDNPNELPVFSPRRPAGIHLVTPVLRGTMTRALDFFQCISFRTLLPTLTHMRGVSLRKSSLMLTRAGHGLTQALEK